MFTLQQMALAVPQLERDLMRGRRVTGPRMYTLDYLPVANGAQRIRAEVQITGVEDFVALGIMSAYRDTSALGSGPALGFGGLGGLTGNFEIAGRWIADKLIPLSGFIGPNTLAVDTDTPYVMAVPVLVPRGSIMRAELSNASGADLNVRCMVFGIGLE